MTACMLPPVVWRRVREFDWPLHAGAWAHQLLWSAEDQRSLASALLDFTEENPSSDVSGGRLFGLSDDEILELFLAESQLEDNRPKPLSRDDRTEWLRAIEAAAVKHGWKGRTASTDRAMFLAAVRHGLASNPVKLNRLPISERDWIELTGLGSRDTVRGSIRRLVEGGYLLQDEVGDGFSAATYSIRWPLEGDVTGPPTCIQDVGANRWTRYDTLSVEQSMAVGKTGHRLIDRLMVESPRTDQEWYQAAGVGRRQFYRVKPFLLDAGLVEKDADGWRPSDQFSDRMDELVEGSGVRERAAQRAARHRVERRGWVGHQVARRGLSDRYEVSENAKLIDVSTGQIVDPAGVLGYRRGES